MLFWTLDEFNTFIKHIVDNATQIAFTLFFYTGMRTGELLALTSNDFNFEDCTVSITKSYTRLDKGDIITPPKTPKSKHIITLPKSVSKLMENYISTLYDIASTDRIFPYTKYFFHHNMSRGCKKSGVKKYVCMTYVTLMRHYL